MSNYPGTVVASSGVSSSPVVLSSGASGGFGGGVVAAYPSSFGFVLNDANPPGTASYAVASSITSYTVGSSGYSGTIGASFGVAGYLPTTGSFAEVSLLLSVTDNTANSLMAGTHTYTILLGDQNLGNGNYNPLDSAQYTSFTQAGTSFQAAGVVDFGGSPVTLAAGDTFTVKATMTAYVDPASIDIIDISNFPGLLPDLPGYSTDVGNAAIVPEPASVVMLGTSLLVLIGYPAARRLRPARAS